jgi:hypothetical protein
MAKRVARTKSTDAIGPKQVIRHSGQTIAEAMQAFTAIWPFLTLRFFDGTPAYYHEGFFAADCGFLPTDPLPRHRPEASITIDGSMNHMQQRNLIYRAFRIEPEIFYVDI